MQELKAQGKTMVFVTHSMDLAKSFCTRGVWLCDGVIKMDGPAEEVGDAYLKATT
jgi:ABC-type polysaccharide/polyol phosphate transport system ATPase subunit